MMTPINIGMMIAIPVLLMGVIGLVALSGAMPAPRRRLIERLLAAVFYPVMVVFWGWYAVDAALERDWLWTVASSALSVGAFFQGIRLIRKPRHADGTRT